MGISGLTGSDHLRGLSGSRTLTGLHGRDHPTGLAGADHLRGLGAALGSLRPPLFGDDPDFPGTVFVYERASWLTRDGEEVEIDVELALSRGIRISVEGDEVVMLR